MKITQIEDSKYNYPSRVVWRPAFLVMVNLL